MNNEEKATARRDRRRVQIIRVGEDLFVDCLMGRTELRGLPDGSRIIRVNYRIECLGWDVMLWHDSFDPVPEGGEVPQYPYSQFWTHGPEGSDHGR